MAHAAKVVAAERREAVAGHADARERAVGADKVAEKVAEVPVAKVEAANVERLQLAQRGRDARAGGGAIGAARAYVDALVFKSVVSSIRRDLCVI